MNINVSYDASAANAPAWFKNAVQTAVGQMDALITNAITVNVTFSWGEENGNAISSGAAGQNQAYGANVDYGTLTSALARAATTADDWTAVAALPTSNPFGNSSYLVTTAMQKALGLDSATATATDGFVGLSSSIPWAYNADGSVTAGAYNPVACIDHEISEVLGRAAYLPSQSSGTHTVLDLFRYAGPGQIETTQGAGSFSIDGQTMLKAFGNPGDAADWAASTIGDIWGNITAGVASTLTATDARVMDVLGYSVNPNAIPASSATTASTAPAPAPAPTPQAVASTPPSVTFGTHVAFLGPRRVTFSGTVSDAAAGIEIFDGSTDLGSASVGADGAWSLTTVLPANSQEQIVAVATNAAGQSTTVAPNFSIATGVRGAPYVTTEQIYDDSGNVTGDVFVKRNGVAHTVMTSYGRALAANHQGVTGQTLATYAETVTGSGDGQTLRAGHDALVTGGGSADTFVFSAAPGQSLVTDFVATGAGHDVLSLAASSFGSIADVLSHTHQVGQDAVVTLGPHEQITLQNTSVAALRHNANDFAFHG